MKIENLVEDLIFIILIALYVRNRGIGGKYFLYPPPGVRVKLYFPKNFFKLSHVLVKVVNKNFILIRE